MFLLLLLEQVAIIRRVYESFSKLFNILLEIFRIIHVIFPQESYLQCEKSLRSCQIFLKVSISLGAGKHTLPDVENISFDFTSAFCFVSHIWVEVPQGKKNCLWGLLLELINADTHNCRKGLIL